MLKTRGGYSSAVYAEQTQGSETVSRRLPTKSQHATWKKSPRRCHKITVTDHPMTPAPAYSSHIDLGHSQIS